MSILEETNRMRFPFLMSHFPNTWGAEVLNKLHIFKKQVKDWGFPSNPWGLTFEEFPGWFPLIVVFTDNTAAVYELSGSQCDRIHFADIYTFLVHGRHAELPEGDWLYSEDESRTPQYLTGILEGYYRPAGLIPIDVVLIDHGLMGTGVVVTLNRGEMRNGIIPPGATVGIWSVVDALCGRR